MTREDLSAALLLVAITIFLFADVLFLGNNFWFRDLFAYHFPMKAVVRDTIARGEFPWWNPWWGGGQPMIANPAYEIFYPPQWLIFVGSYPFGFALHIVAHVAIALVGMYAFLRSIPLGVGAALFGALSFGLSGFFFGTMTNLPTFFVWAWAGVVGWAVLRLIRGGGIAAAALALAMPMLVFEPMALAQMLALVIAGAAYVDRRSLPRVFAAIGLAIAISAVVIIPAIDHTHDSIRSRGFSHDLAIDYSMPAARPIELIAPRIFGVLPDIRTWWGYRFFGVRGTPYFMSIYCGVAVAILAIAAFVKRMRGWGLVLGIGAISYLLALGSPLFDWVWAASRHSIRYPEKFIGAALVTLIVFAATALDRISELRRITVIVAVVVAAVLWLLAPLMSISFSSFWRAPGELASLARGTLIFSACIATMWAIVFWKFGVSRIYALIGVLLLLIDFGSLSNEILPRMPRRFFTPPPVALQLEPGSTIFHRGAWTQEKLARQFERANQPLAMRDGLRGYTPALWGFRSALTDLLPTYDLLNTMLKRGNAGDPHWSEPFVRISNVREILDYTPTSLSVTRVPNNGRYWFAKKTGRVLHVTETSSSVTLDVDVTETSLLIITITRHKYWRATIDGQPAQLMPANIAYQSLSVPPGRHRVEIRYRNPLVGWGAAITAIGLIALIPRRRRPRSES
ncbi:MAG: hypothetical protein DMF59_18360 [Acidobacteria bacterium]|nr:MAG: hypothetical protein DMF59_18360 [Acidobacteriota bacterium]